MVVYTYFFSPVLLLFSERKTVIVILFFINVFFESIKLLENLLFLKFKFFILIGISSNEVDETGADYTE